MAESSNSSKRTALPAAIVIAMSLLALPAGAQIDPLPDPCKVAAFSAAEQQQIQDFITKRMTLIESGSDADRERARDDILAPLRRQCVSVAFRQALRAAAITPLTTLAGNDDPEISINALFLLGEIADDASRQVLQEHTSRSDPTIRYAAIRAMDRTFRVVNAFAPSLDANRVSEMVAHLGGRMAEETDPYVLDAIIRALISVSNIRRDGYATPAAQAISRAADGIVGRLRKADPAQRAIVLESSVRVAEALDGRLTGAANASPEIARVGAAFAGESLAYLACMANGSGLGDERKREVDLANLSERILVFAHQKLGRPLSAPGLASLLDSGNDREFFARAREVVLRLDGPPCNLSGETMQRIRDTLECK